MSSVFFCTKQWFCFYSCVTHTSINLICNNFTKQCVHFNIFHFDVGHSFTRAYRSISYGRCFSVRCLITVQGPSFLKHEAMSWFISQCSECSFIVRSFQRNNNRSSFSRAYRWLWCGTHIFEFCSSVLMLSFEQSENQYIFTCKKRMQRKKCLAMIWESIH